MMNPLTKLCVLLLFLPVSGVFADDFNTYRGIWINADAVIPKLSITIENNSLFVGAWEKCNSGSCYWGSVEAKAFTRTSSNQLGILRADYQLDHGHALISLQPTGNQMKAVIVLSNPSVGSKSTMEYLYKKEINHTSYTDVTPVVEKPKSLGAINGVVFGPAKSIASIFHVSLYGPDNGNKLVKSQHLKTKSFSFDGLPDGKYWLMIDSKGHTGIQAFPRYKVITIQDGKEITQNVELK